MRSLLMTLSTVSLVSLTACGSIPKPVGDLCGVNARASQLRCYRMERDFDDDGKLKRGAQPTIKTISTLMDLNAYIVADPDAYAELRIFGGRVREKLKECAK